jgi:hypothetical protein
MAMSAYMSMEKSWLKGIRHLILLAPEKPSEELDN